MLKVVIRPRLSERLDEGLSLVDELFLRRAS